MKFRLVAVERLKLLYEHLKKKKSEPRNLLNWIFWLRFSCTFLLF